MAIFTQREIPPENPAHTVENEAHVWLIYPPLSMPSDRWNVLRNTLSTEEKTRADRFIFEKDRLLFTVAHSCLRHVLSKYADIPPADWHFDKGKHGRPEITPSLNTDQLRFNLSHTRGLVACVINRVYDCGVDVEQISRVRNPLALARGFFSQTESETLEKCGSEEDQRRLFCRYWTLKEAYIKALGRGLSLPLNNFYFTFNETGIQIHQEAEVPDGAQSWQLYQTQPTADHMLAVALGHTENPPLHIRLFDFPGMDP